MLLLANKYSKPLWPLWPRLYYQTCYVNITKILNFFSYLYSADQKVHTVHLNYLHHFFHMAQLHKTNKNLHHLLDVWMLTEGLQLSFGHSTQSPFTLKKLHHLFDVLKLTQGCYGFVSTQPRFWHFLPSQKLHHLLGCLMLTQGCYLLASKPRFWSFHSHKNFITQLMSRC